MKYVFLLLAVGCLLSAVHAQWLEVICPAGSYPCALCYNPQNDEVYVACEGSNQVTVIDGATNRVTARIAAGFGVALCWNQVNNRVYCADLGPDTVSVIDCTTDSVIATVGIDRAGPAIHRDHQLRAEFMDTTLQRLFSKAVAVVDPVRQKRDGLCAQSVKRLDLSTLASAKEAASVS